jgi:hypothetical protein
MEVDLTGSGLCTPNPSLIVTRRLGDAAGAGHRRLHLHRTGIGRPQPVCLWNPRSGRVLHRSDRVLAASGTTIAWVAAACGPNRCPVHLSDLAAGADIQVAVPWRARANGGAFSPTAATWRWCSAAVTPARVGSSTWQPGGCLVCRVPSW